MRTGASRRGLWAALVTAVLASSALPASAAVNYNALLFFSEVPDAAGYRVYVRRNSGNYDAPVDVGRRSADTDGVVTYAVSSLTLVNHTHFGVTSYDARGVESDMSNEITLDRATIAASAGTPENDDATPPASVGSDDRLSIDLPLYGWKQSSGSGTFALEGDTLVTESDEEGRPLQIRYPAAGSLGSQLPEVVFDFSAERSAELSAVVRVAGGGRRQLYYRLEEGPARVRGRRAYIPIGLGSGARSLRRDLADDVQRLFGSDFLHVEHVSVVGSVELAGVTLLERGEGAARLERAVAVPVAEWTPRARRGYGPVADEDLGGVALASDGSRRVVFPGHGRGRLVAPFERLSMLVRDPSEDFSVRVQVETDSTRARWLSFGASNEDAGPLDLRPGSGSPYDTVLLDLVGNLQTVAPGETLQHIRQIRFGGGFQVTGVRLLEPLQ